MPPWRIASGGANRWKMKNCGVGAAIGAAVAVNDITGLVKHEEGEKVGKKGKNMMRMIHQYYVS